MPLVTIEIRRPCEPAHADALISAVHRAMMDALKTPSWDAFIRLIEHDPQRFLAGPKASDEFTLVSIDLFPGRALEAKRRLYAEIVRNFGELGIPADQVMILLREEKPENWGVLGGVPASDLDITGHLSGATS